MSFVYFPATETLEILVKTVDGANQVIDGSMPFTKIFKRWIFPIESGTTDPITLEDDNTKTNYSSRGITTSLQGYVGEKPFMLTLEGNNIIAYTLDFKVLTSGLKTVSPNVIDDGNDLIKKLSGGAIDGDALTWEILVADGQVLDEFDVPVLTTAPLYPTVGGNAPQRPPAPFLLMRRQDIA